MQKTSFKFFCLSTEKFRWGTFRCFINFRVSKNFRLKKGISLLSVEIVLSHSAERIRRGTLLCFKKILVSEISMHRRGSITDLESITVLSKKFCLTGSKNFRVSKNFWYGIKSWIIGGGGWSSTNFQRNFFVSQYRKTPWGTLLRFRNFLVWKKVMDKEGGITIFGRLFFLSQCRKNLWGTLLCFRNFLVSKSFMDTRGGGKGCHDSKS